MSLLLFLIIWCPSNLHNASIRCRNACISLLIILGRCPTYLSIQIVHQRPLRFVVGCIKPILFFKILHRQLFLLTMKFAQEFLKSIYPLGNRHRFIIQVGSARLHNQFLLSAGRSRHDLPFLRMLSISNFYDACCIYQVVINALHIRSIDNSIMTISIWERSMLI